MENRFTQLTNELPILLDKLVSCDPSVGKPAPDAALPQRAVYLFSDDTEHLYVGRTNRLKARIKEHVSGSNNDAPFAFKLARYVTGHFRGKGSMTRKQLELDPDFCEVFQLAKIHVSELEWRWVRIDDPNLQCLFEIYATLELGATYNDFENH